MVVGVKLKPACYDMRRLGKAEQDKQKEICSVWSALIFDQIAFLGSNSDVCFKEPSDKNKYLNTQGGGGTAIKRTASQVVEAS